MNSIDAVIAVAALTAGFGIMIFSITSQKGSYELINSELLAKANAIKCGEIINSIYSNSAEAYSEGINCTSKTNTLTAINGGVRKSTQIITDANTSTILQIKMTKHYLGD